MTELDKDQNKDAPSKEQGSQENQGKDQGDGKLIAGKFKDTDELANAYLESQKKLGEQGNEIGELRNITETTSALVTAVFSDPDLKATIEKKYGAGEKSDANISGDNKQYDVRPDPKVADLDTFARNEAIKKFDERWGLPQDEAERTKIHQKVANELSALGHDVKTAPSYMLESLLDKAYRLAYPDKVSEKAKTEGAAQAVTNMRATIPTQGGSTITGADGKPQFTEEQKQWLNALRVPENKAQEVLSKQENT